MPFNAQCSCTHCKALSLVVTRSHGMRLKRATQLVRQPLLYIGSAAMHSGSAAKSLVDESVWRTGSKRLSKKPLKLGAALQMLPSNDAMGCVSAAGRRFSSSLSLLQRALLGHGR